MDDLWLRRKWTFRAQGKQVVLVKKPLESSEHVLMKALLWALYLPEYPHLGIEIRIGDRYKPDVVQLDALARPLFWGEAGKVSTSKIRALARRYRHTHFAIAKWGERLAPHTIRLETALRGLPRSAPFDLISFPHDSASRFLTDVGEIHLTHQELQWIRL